MLAWVRSRVSTNGLCWFATILSVTPLPYLFSGTDFVPFSSSALPALGCSAGAERIRLGCSGACPGYRTLASQALPPYGNSCADRRQQNNRSYCCESWRTFPLLFTLCLQYAII